MKNTYDVAARLRAVRTHRKSRWLASVVLALRMMLHDKAKFAGTIVGVVFAVVLASEQVGLLMGLLSKNTMLVDNAGADIWIAPPNTTQVQPGQRLSTQLLHQARSTPGVARASALIVGGTSISKPGGGTEGITLVGVDLETMLGGPWNVVTGDPADLRHADTLFFDDAQRERFGGLNLGSVREVGGYQVRVGGFTWGLLPFGAAYTFAEADTARTIMGMPSDQLNFVLVDVAPGADTRAVAAELAARMPMTTVITAEDFSATIMRTLLVQQLGITFGTSTVFGLLIGFIIVALSMFSAVIDNLREFGTLKAIGMTNWDLTRMLVVQSVAYAVIGSFIGLGLTGFLAEGIRSANMVVIVPRALIFGLPVIMTLLCILASTLALRRVRKLEPGMVFR
jgi:putative ABC transport system permease protein